MNTFGVDEKVLLPEEGEAEIDLSGSVSKRILAPASINKPAPKLLNVAELLDLEREKFPPTTLELIIRSTADKPPNVGLN